MTSTGPSTSGSTPVFHTYRDVDFDPNKPKFVVTTEGVWEPAGERARSVTTKITLAAVSRRCTALFGELENSDRGHKARNKQELEQHLANTQNLEKKVIQHARKSWEWIPLIGKFFGNLAVANVKKKFYPVVQEIAWCLQRYGGGDVLARSGVTVTTHDLHRFTPEASGPQREVSSGAAGVAQHALPVTPVAQYSEVTVTTHDLQRFTPEASGPQREVSSGAAGVAQHALPVTPVAQYSEVTVTTHDLQRLTPEASGPQREVSSVVAGVAQHALPVTPMAQYVDDLFNNGEDYGFHQARLTGPAKILNRDAAEDLLRGGKGHQAEGDDTRFLFWRDQEDTSTFGVSILKDDTVHHFTITVHDRGKEIQYDFGERTGTVAIPSLQITKEHPDFPRPLPERQDQYKLLFIQNQLRAILRNQR